MEARETTDNDASGGSAAAALATISTGISLLLDPERRALLGDENLLELLVGVEREARRLHALQVDLLNDADRRALHHIDGHASAKVLVRHLGQLSPAAAARRAQVGRAVLDLPDVAQAHRQGEIGAEQMELVARVHANPRVREALIGHQAGIVTTARGCAQPDFEVALRTWERLADADGAEPRAERAHRRRRFGLRQDPFDLSWRVTGSLGPMQGAMVSDVLGHFTDLEWEQDWAEARAAHGDQATPADLPRTDDQRAADALEHICERAAAASPESPGPEVVHNIVWDADTYFATVHRLTCDELGCEAPGHTDATRWYDPATYRCETIDGAPLEPMEAALSSLGGFGSQIRRVLVRSRSVTIDLGRKARLFTGSARSAVQLHSTRCLWPGCLVPVSACEADHVEPYARGGPTSPANGAPLCGRHNRWKQKGYVTWRDPAGRWHVARPNGIEIR